MSTRAQRRRRGRAEIRKWKLIVQQINEVD